jgi:hypothetical protein
LERAVLRMLREAAASADRARRRKAA